MTNVYAAILAGGSGTRFWPASTAVRPKQFLPLTGGEPLVVETARRLDGLVTTERTLIVTSAGHADLVRELMPQLPAENVIAEPTPRNTAAACAVAAHVVEARDPGSVLLTLPSDHTISPDEDLRAALRAAAERSAGADVLLTLGLRPRSAATGFGWIEFGDEVARVAGHEVRSVVRFVEKPDRGRAEVYLARGTHLWNLGMFAWRPAVFLAELEKALPEVAVPLASAAASADGDPLESLLAAFPDCASISVDHGVLESSDAVECVPCSFEWDDLGAFEALVGHLPKDNAGNAHAGGLLAIDSAENLSWVAEDELVALLGVHDLIVVHTGKVTMVAPRALAQDVRRFVEALKERADGDLYR